MSYATMIAIAGNSSLTQRMTACAAQEGVTYPESWIDQRRWGLIGADWIAAWDYADQTYTVNQNPDAGARTDVITDQMILSAVQAAVQAEQPE